MMLAAGLEQLPEAELVQHDTQWRERLDGWLRFGGRVAWVLAFLLGLGALLVVGNTVRLDIQSRREEISVLQLLGATDGFIRRPFLYLGAWYGIRSEEHTSELQSLMRISYAVFCLKKKKNNITRTYYHDRIRLYKKI